MTSSADQPQPLINPSVLNQLSEVSYRAFFNAIDQGYCLIQIILDEQGQPIDLLHLEANQAYLHQTGLYNIVGKRLLERVGKLCLGYWLDAL